MRFVFEQRVPAPPERVFTFFADPCNLAVLHSNDGTFRLLRHSGSIAPNSETWVEYTIAHVLPMVFGFRHVAWDPPRWFSEECVHGPFAGFTHRHEFLPVVEGTLVRDLIDIRLPRSCGGEATMKWCVASVVESRFRLRHSALARFVSLAAESAP